MRGYEFCIVEVPGKRVTLPHEGNYASLLLRQALRQPAGMRRILRLHWNILSKPSTALARETQHDKICTHDWLPARFYVRHHDSETGTQQEQNRRGDLIRKIVKTLMFSMVLGTTSGFAQAQDSDLCGGRLHDVDGKQAVFVSAAEASCPWGFTVDKLVITCETRATSNKLYALTATTEQGESYALNGIASQWLKLESIRPIWKDREDLPGAKIDLTPWMEVGESICQF